VADKPGRGAPLRTLSGGRGGPAQGSLSNRKGTGSDIEPCPGRTVDLVGLDRVSLSFPVTDYERDQDSWSRVAVSNPGGRGQVKTWSTTERVGEATVFVGVADIAAVGQLRGKVEFNPSRVVDPEGWGLALPAELGEALGEVLPTVRQYVRPASDVADWAVRRVDVARDFRDVSEPGNKVRALAPLPRPWARRNLVHSDPSKHGAQTLMVGSGAGVVRLYDKCAETQGRAPEGVLRWEAECRSDWAAKYGGLRVVADVTDVSCRALAEDRWRWSGIGAEVGAMSRVYSLVRSSGLSVREQNGFLMYLWGQAAGDMAYSGKEAMAKYRRIQRQLGLVIEPASLGMSEGIVSRLDWETGREVFRAA
jgi:hypothetical protein